jgi:hypothetical protein
VNKICDFFVDMLAKELSFNTITGYRTAISEIHEHIDNAPIGSHPDISRFMHAIHSENPPPTKSDDPINITPSLDHIKELGDNDDISTHDLSMKTAFLLALVTASRPSDLRRINLSTLKVTHSSLMVECIKLKEYNITKVQYIH